jgi:signal transduction histidine kinase
VSVPAALPTLGPRRRSRLRPRLTARLRLTLLYSAMFLALGTGAIALIYTATSTTSAVAVRAVPRTAATPGASPAGGARPVPAGQGPALGITFQHDADVKRLLTVSWLVLIVAALASAGLGWVASGRVLRPLREMTDTARTITAGNLERRLAIAGPDDEFKALGDTLDDLLARLEAAFDAQRRFVAHASHELRTPLTVERTLLQVALSDPHSSEASLRATCEELLAAGRDHERLLEALLTLAAGERALDAHVPLQLPALAGAVLTARGGEIARRDLQLTTDLSPAAITGETHLIERLIANLVENAIDHNRPGGRITLRTDSRDGRARLTIVNTGDAIGTEEIERLFEPFQRLDTRRSARADGHHGLGLSIVRTIATAHGATVTAWAPDDGGLGLTITFPQPAEVDA